MFSKLLQLHVSYGMQCCESTTEIYHHHYHHYYYHHHYHYYHHYHYHHTYPTVYNYSCSMIGVYSVRLGYAYFSFEARVQKYNSSIPATNPPITPTACLISEEKEGRAVSRDSGWYTSFEIGESARNTCSSLKWQE